MDLDRRAVKIIHFFCDTIVVLDQRVIWGSLRTSSLCQWHAGSSVMVEGSVKVSHSGNRMLFQSALIMPL